MKHRFLSLMTFLIVSIAAIAQNKMFVNMKDGRINEFDVEEIFSVSWGVKEDAPTENAPDEPTVTGDAKDVTYNSATLVCYANILDNLSSDLSVGVIYCTEGTPSKNNGIQKTIYKSGIAEDGKYVVELTGLTDVTTYYYRSFVYQSGIWFYGKIKQFTTKGSSVVTTGSASKVTCYSAKISSSIDTENKDYSRISSFGIFYGEEETPTIREQVSTKESSGNYTATLRALKGNTKYYYRSYVTINGVTYYGATSSFKTLEDNVVTTGEADSDGNVRSKLTIGNGAYSKLELGVCWSTSNETPTIADEIVYTNEVDDENYFSVRPDFRYGRVSYYRSYVKIDGVAHYGEVKIFDKEVPVGNAIDLGLSVKWADMNVGADKPEDYGYYYAWGETEPKAEYNWGTYFDSVNGSSSNFDKYATNKKTVLDPEDDVAHVKWGGDWRMPTKAEQDELRTKCKWTWGTKNGVKGYTVVGPNGNSLFLPAAGYRSNSDLYHVGSYGSYWSSSLDSSRSYCAYYLRFDSSLVDWYVGRCFGHTVRPVCP